MKIYVLTCCAVLHLATGTELVPSHDGLRFVKPTACDERECPHGGCVFRDCNEPVSNCKSPDCGGGVCTIVEAEDGSCPGGLCNFVKPKRSLKEDYCTGGLCLVDSKGQVSSPGSLSEPTPTEAPVIAPTPDQQSPVASQATTDAA
ncbi:hypothetical protein DYB37_005390 [Aphanomyces astaci]|uniref:Uncharacterized protein n=1 Tax=Aphanomyces astaci TaxID=112090 RepID=A0A397D228_APHAT|nr:hypothetical protein DYB38_003648 [Aphanomyces astaci]RHY92064.1 hypothetical protein DYB35_003476 [Aphanomyces astaci]RHZ34389.1 hypothetical protein DYB37_005390 [Aphanomyces astaci]